MRAGQLRHRVNIQSMQGGTGLDTAGQPTAVMTNWKTSIPASIETAGGSESRVAKQLDPQANVLVTLRYIEGLTTEMQIVFGSRVLRIVSINNTDQRNIQQAVSCIEEV